MCQFAFTARRVHGMCRPERRRGRRGRSQALGSQEIQELLAGGAQQLARLQYDLAARCLDHREYVSRVQMSNAIVVDGMQHVTDL